MIDYIRQLVSNFPEFWTKTLDETTLLNKLFKIYSMSYVSAQSRLDQLYKSFSIKTIVPYKYDYYPLISCLDENRFVPTTMVTSYTNCFKIPFGIFNYETLAYDSDFISPVSDYRILYDNIKREFFLAIGDAEFEKNVPKHLFAKSYKSTQVEYPFARFYTFQPLMYKSPDWTQLNATTFVVPSMLSELEYIKAQYTNMMFLSVNGPTYDAYDSLFAVVFRKKYSKFDGEVLDFNDTNVWIKHPNDIAHYQVSKLKNKFKAKGSIVRQFEALEPAPVELYAWHSNPAKFTQTIISNHGYFLRKITELYPGEKENSLVYNDTLNYDQSCHIYYDMGGYLLLNDIAGYGINNGRFYGGGAFLLQCHWRHRNEWWYKNKEYPQAIANNDFYPGGRGWTSHFQPFRFNTPEMGDNLVTHYYKFWHDARFPNYFYEALRYFVVWQTNIASEYHSWIEKVLAFYKPLHVKYIASPMNGVNCQDSHGYGKVYGRHYGGQRCSTKHGYGYNYGRRYAGAS